ncbi:MAG TPA: hypothetical protein PLB18_21870 [Acidobacteriota bacterium]|nr:hypothetical protein [Acidobacteriota bacterium]HNJ39583.1 hypothetical protein [Acidobacteriota bacterium]
MSQFAAGSSPDRSSKFAKISVIIAVVNLGMMVLLLLGVVGSETLRDVFTDERWSKMLRTTSDVCFISLIYYALSIGPLGFLVGISLSIIGTFRTGLKKGMGIFGLVCNFVLFVGVVILDIVIGLAAIGLSALAPR